MSGERSKYEGYSDKLLFVFLKRIYEKGLKPNLNSESFINSLDEISQILGNKDSLDYIDLDYLTCLYNLNIDKFKDDKLTQPLDRPQIGKYLVETTADVTEVKTVVYANTVNSYSKTTAKEVLIFTYNAGDFYFDEGEVVYQDFYDTDVNSVQWGEAKKIE